MSQDERAKALDDLEIQRGFYLLFADGGIVADPPGQSGGVAAVGVVLKDPKDRGGVKTHSRQIGYVANHHIAEYQALVDGLNLARERDIKYLGVFLDSRLVVNQVNGVWENKSMHLERLCDEARELTKHFPGIQISWIPREWNQAHALADEELKDLRG